MTDEQFWKAMRRAFLGMMASAESPAMRAAVGQAVAAIEKRYGVGDAQGNEAKAQAETNTEERDSGVWAGRAQTAEFVIRPSARSVA